MPYETLEEIRRKAQMKWNLDPLSEDDLINLGIKSRTMDNLQPLTEEDKINLGITTLPEMVLRDIKPMNQEAFTAEESDFIKMAQDRHGDLGFTFTEDEQEHALGQDWVRVTAPNGAFIDIGTDYGAGSEYLKKEKEKYEKFIRDHTDFEKLPGGKWMEKVEDIDGERQTIDLGGVQYGYNETFDIYNDQKDLGFDSIEELTDEYQSLRNEALTLEKDGEKLSDEKESRLKELFGVGKDFDYWLDLNTSGKTTQQGNQMFGTTPTGRSLRKSMKELADKEEEFVAGQITTDDIFGKGMHAVEAGFLHSALEIRTPDGEVVEVNLQATKTGILFGRDTKAENVNKLMETYTRFNPNVGIFADPDSQREFSDKNKDLDKINEYMTQGYTVLESEKKAIKASSDRQKRNSVVGNLFQHADNLRSWQVSYSSGDMLDYRQRDKEALEGTNWQIRTVKSEKFGGEDMFLYQKIKDSWVKVDLLSNDKTSYNTRSRKEKETYEQITKYIYENATNKDIREMHSNMKKQEAGILKEINSQINIEVSDKDAMHKYIDSGDAESRFKEDLAQFGLSEQGMIEVEGFLNGEKNAIKNFQKVAGMDEAGFILDWALTEKVRDWKLTKFGNMGALANVMTEEDADILRQVIESRKGF